MINWGDRRVSDNDGPANRECGLICPMAYITVCLTGASLFVCWFVFLVFCIMCSVVSTSAIDCLERLVSKINYTAQRHPANSPLLVPQTPTKKIWLRGYHVPFGAVLSLLSCSVILYSHASSLPTSKLPKHPL